MSTRHVREYCSHCRCEQWCTLKGWGLYCDAKDHFVRSKRAAKRKAPTSTSMYKDVRGHINDTFNGRGTYTWDELIIWCTRTHFNDLKGFCEDMREVECSTS